MSYLTGIQRSSLYLLKRSYGEAIVIHKLLTSVVEPTTGVETFTKTVINVDRAIVLPTMYSRQEKNRGSFDLGVCDFILDRSDIDLSTLTQDDWIVRSGSVYQVEKVQAFEPGTGWIVTAKECKGVEQRLVQVDRSVNQQVSEAGVVGAVNTSPS